MMALRDAELSRIAFLGCGFITRVHSRNLHDSRARSSAATPAMTRRKRRLLRYTARQPSDYADAINDPNIDAVVVAVPRGFTST